MERYKFDLPGIYFLEELINTLNELWVGHNFSIAGNFINTDFLLLEKCNCTMETPMKSQNSLFLTATRRYLFSPRVRSQFIKLPLNLLKFRKTLEFFFSKFLGFLKLLGPEMAQIYKLLFLLETKTLINSISTQLVFDEFHK